MTLLNLLDKEHIKIIAASFLGASLSMAMQFMLGWKLNIESIIGSSILIGVSLIFYLIIYYVLILLRYKTIK